jgi:dCMP deaminase
MLQAKVAAVYYLHDWNHPDPAHKAEYERLQAGFPGGIRRLDIADPEAKWAVGKRLAEIGGASELAGEDQHGTQDQ